MSTSNLENLLISKVHDYYIFMIPIYDSYICLGKEVPSYMQNVSYISWPCLVLPIMNALKRSSRELFAHL